MPHPFATFVNPDASPLCAAGTLRPLFALACAGLLLIGAAPVAWSQEAVAAMAEPQRQDLSYTLPAGQPIMVDNPYGNVYLRFGGYAHELGLHNTLQQPAGAPGITLAPGAEGGRFVIAPRLPAGVALAEAQRLDIVVYVPERHAVMVRTGSGAIESRGVKSDLDLHSVSGNIAVRGNDGSVQAQTDEGQIEASFAERARPGSRQRLATTTGSITLGVTDRLQARVALATSGLISTDYSLEVAHRDGEEPNKRARADIGVPRSRNSPAEVVLESRRGDIRLLRQAVYVEAGEEPRRGGAKDGEQR